LLQRIFFLLASYFVFQNINLYFIYEGFTTRRIGLIILVFLFLLNLKEIDFKKVSKFNFRFIVFLVFLILTNVIIFKIELINSYFKELISGLLCVIVFSVLIKKHLNFNYKDLRYIALFSAFLNFFTILIQFHEYGEISIFSLRIHNVTNPNFNLNNFFNGFIFFSPLYLLGYKIEKKRITKLIYLLLFFFNVSFVILSTSRQAIFGTLLLLFPFYKNIFNLRLIIFVLSLIFIITFTSFFEKTEFIYNALMSRFQSSSADNYRLNKYMDSFIFFKQNIIGIGLGNSLALERGPLESSFLQILIETGILGVIASLIFYLNYLYNFFYFKNNIIKYFICTVFFLSIFNEFLISCSGILLLLLAYNFKNYKSI